MDKKLYDAVVTQFGGLDVFKEVAPDICEYGMVGGFSRWTYYSDTVAFFNKNRRAILNYAKELADDLGQDMLEMITSFSSLRDYELTVTQVAEALYDDNAEFAAVIRNTLAWVVAEEAARILVEEEDEEGEPQED